MINGCKNKPAKSSTTKVGEDVATAYSVSKISSYKT